MLNFFIGFPCNVVDDDPQTDRIGDYVPKTRFFAPFSEYDCRSVLVHSVPACRLDGVRPLWWPPRLV